MKIAAQLYTVREFIQDKDGFERSMEKIKNIGYDSIQLSGISKWDAEFIKKCLDDAGLSICATHIPPDMLLNETDKVIAEHKLWGCKYIGIGWYAGLWENNDKSFREKVDAFAELFTPICEKLHREGMKFMYHNHALEFQHIDGGQTILEYLVSKMPRGKFGIISDFYWTQIGGANNMEFIEKYGDLLNVVHFKDLLPQGNEPKMAPVGEGNINYKKIYKALETNGATEAVAVEQDDCCGDDPFSCLKRSFDNIKRFM